MSKKMAFAKLTGRERDKSIIEYNPYITIKGIPVEAYDYVVNGKPAIEWVMERYRIVVDKDSGIKNDPNDWCREHDDPEYIFRLVQQVVRVSVETQKVREWIPEVGERNACSMQEVVDWSHSQYVPFCAEQG